LPSPASFARDEPVHLPLQNEVPADIHLANAAADPFQPNARSFVLGHFGCNGLKLWRNQGQSSRKCPSAGLVHSCPPTTLFQMRYASRTLRGIKFPSDAMGHRPQGSEPNTGWRKLRALTAPGQLSDHARCWRVWLRYEFVIPVAGCRAELYWLLDFFGPSRLIETANGAGCVSPCNSKQDTSLQRLLIRLTN